MPWKDYGVKSFAEDARPFVPSCVAISAMIDCNRDTIYKKL